MLFRKHPIKDFSDGAKCKVANEHHSELACDHLPLSVLSICVTISKKCLLCGAHYDSLVRIDLECPESTSLAGKEMMLSIHWCHV